MQEKIKVEIFGKGCKNCDLLEKNTVLAGELLDIPLDIQKVKDMDEMIERGVFKTPGLAINGRVVSTGRVLNRERIAELLQE